MADDDLESRLKKKLETGEITKDEYDQLFAKFQRLGILDDQEPKSQRKPHLDKRGSTIIDGGNIDGPVNISGRAIVDGNLNCKRLFISGNANVDGNLTVEQKASIFGTLEVNGNCKFGGQNSTSGVLKVDHDLYAMVKSSISGKATVGGTITTDGRLIITGRLSASKIRSSSSIKVEGKINISDDIIAEEFECLKGTGKVSGDLRAKIIRIFTNYRQISKTSEKSHKATVDIGEMISNVVNVIFPKVIEQFQHASDPQPSRFDIDGDVEGDFIDISYCDISGDIHGNQVSIGPNVNVGGTIYYTDFIETPENREYSIQKVNS